MKHCLSRRLKLITQWRLNYTFLLVRYVGDYFFFFGVCVIDPIGSHPYYHCRSGPWSGGQGERGTRRPRKTRNKLSGKYPCNSKRNNNREKRNYVKMKARGIVETTYSHAGLMCVSITARVHADNQGPRVLYLSPLLDEDLLQPLRWWFSTQRAHAATPHNPRRPPIETGEMCTRQSLLVHSPTSLMVLTPSMFYSSTGGGSVVWGMQRGVIFRFNYHILGCIRSTN